jgi:hypothetical protein
MTESIFALAKDYPIVLPVGVVFVLVIGAWHVATTYTNFRYMRENMVSKKDLEIALLKTQESNDERYIKRSGYANGEVLTADQISKQHHRKGKAAGGD